MVKGADNSIVTKVEVVRVGPSPEDLALRLIEALQIQYGAPLNGTNHPDGSVTIENEQGEVVGRVLPDGTAILYVDGGEQGVCLGDLGQELLSAEEPRDKTQSGMTEDDIWASLDDYLQDSCDPCEQSCQWDDAQQTQNNSKPFSNSESYTAKSQQGSSSSSSSTSTSTSTSTVPQVERKETAAANTGDRAPKKPGDAAPASGSAPTAAGGAAAPDVAGDPNLAPASMPPAPEAVTAPAASPALSMTASTSEANPASQEQERGARKASESRPYPGVSALRERMGQLVRFVEAIIRGDEAAPRRDQGDPSARAAGALHPGSSSDASARLQPLPISEPMTGREGRAPAADSVVASSALVRPTAQLHTQPDVAQDFPMGQVIRGLIAEMANDPLAIACATSAAGLFQLPPFTFAIGSSLSAITALAEQRYHERVQPMATAQRGHGEERGQHDEQQQGRNQQQPDPYAAELA